MVRQVSLSFSMDLIVFHSLFISFHSHFFLFSFLRILISFHSPFILFLTSIHPSFSLHSSIPANEPDTLFLLTKSVHFPCSIVFRPFPIISYGVKEVRKREKERNEREKEKERKDAIYSQHTDCISFFVNFLSFSISFSFIFSIFSFPSFSVSPNQHVRFSFILAFTFLYLSVSYTCLPECFFPSFLWLLIMLIVICFSFLLSFFTSKAKFIHLVYLTRLSYSVNFYCYAIHYYFPS